MFVLSTTNIPVKNLSQVTTTLTPIDSTKFSTDSVQSSQIQTETTELSSVDVPLDTTPLAPQETTQTWSDDEGEAVIEFEIPSELLDKVHDKKLTDVEYK